MGMNSKQKDNKKAEITIDLIFIVIFAIRFLTRYWIFNSYLSFFICIIGGGAIAYLIFQNKQYLSKSYKLLMGIATFLIVGDNVIFLYNALVH